ncbi:SDR family NAD(P)-dependent oxidoreductase [Paenibacillus sp. ISL-20]|uniref:SDR family oxidoreductase n=1 Tax=Paenibacillus sp. ISL-20 TaxID=2819163 RepID=UPI001BE60A7C|nr:SDR family NAD(P)-dependent oxidoreductase [Paenibacillus sp. ISL-20]MBT2762682.1 SDR family oxidoreductase [Paenibacillus sp. ISL-20]
MGNRILVTGGSKGIGRATVLSLVNEGHHVAFTYREDDEGARSLCKEAESFSGTVFAVKADAKDYSAACKVIEEINAKFEGIDGIVVNAGANKDKPFFLMSEEDWDEVVGTNLKGTYNYVKAAIYGMIQQGFGRIVCVSSVSGMIGVPGQVNYSASKAGQIGFIKSLSKEVAKYGITVNGVAPGFIDTNMWEAMKPNQKRKVLNDIPAGRVGSPQEVADVIQFLLSSKASYITGTVVVVDGGLSS